MFRTAMLSGQSDRRRAEVPSAQLLNSALSGLLTPYGLQLPVAVYIIFNSYYLILILFLQEYSPSVLRPRLAIGGVHLIFLLEHI